MSEFHQAPPLAPNRFRTDRTFRYALERLLPADVFAAAAGALDRMGERAAHELPALADTAEKRPPALRQYDAWGHRVDRIEQDPAFDRLVAIGQEEGLVALPYEAPYGAHTRIVQAGLIHLFDPVSATAACPLTMSDGAAWLLGKHDPALAARYVPKLTSRAGGWTSGQWMTEREGGSDVGRTATTARVLPDGSYLLSGTKWFTSATSADMALVLARPENAALGSGGLSLFLVELKRPDGGWNGIRVRRLKEKMGTHALPTAELDLKKTIGFPVGGIGRGVSKVASLLNVARLWASLAGPAAVGHMLALARDYAAKREVFGKPLRNHPMHTAWLAHIAADYEAMLGLCFETAKAVGEAEHGGNAAWARLLTPLTKLSCARQAIAGTSELLESFGGAGYVEDTGLPRLFRNTHVHTIWEGTTNVLAHDVLRALADRSLAEAWLDDIIRRLAGVTHPELEPIVPRVRDGLEKLRPLVLEPDENEGRRMAQGMARVTQAAILAEAAQWRVVHKNDRSALLAVEIVTRQTLVAERSSDMPLEALAYGEGPEEAAPELRAAE